MKVDVSLTEKAFRRFAWFDLLTHWKMWRAPAAFALILSACGAVCFWQSQIRGAALLGGVLLAVGLGVPCVYFGAFFLSVGKKARALGLKEPRYVYSLELPADGDEIRVKNQKEEARYPWAGVCRAYRVPGAVYLYITAERAFILPDDCVKEGPEALWNRITAWLPAEKCTRRDGK